MDKEYRSFCVLSVIRAITPFSALLLLIYVTETCGPSIRAGEGEGGAAVLALWNHVVPWLIIAVAWHMCVSLNRAFTLSVTLTSRGIRVAAPAPTFRPKMLVESVWQLVRMTDLRRDGFLMSINGVVIRIPRSFPRIEQLYADCAKLCPNSVVARRGAGLRARLLGESLFESAERVFLRPVVGRPSVQIFRLVTAGLTDEAVRAYAHEARVSRWRARAVIRDIVYRVRRDSIHADPARGNVDPE